MPLYISLCIKRMKDIFGDNLILLNYKNLGKYIPKLPLYFENIREIAVKVDYIRIAVLYYNSGVYLDVDCIVFPNFRLYLENIIVDKYSLIGLGKNNVISGNAFLVAPVKRLLVLERVMERQVDIIGKKLGRLYWSEIGGNLIKEISGKIGGSITLDKNPLLFCGWRNSDIFFSKLTK